MDWCADSGWLAAHKRAGARLVASADVTLSDGSLERWDRAKTEAVNDCSGLLIGVAAASCRQKMGDKPAATPIAFWPNQRRSD